MGQKNPHRNHQKSDEGISLLLVRLVTHRVPLQVVRAVAQAVVSSHLVQGAQRHRREGGVRHLKPTADPAGVRNAKRVEEGRWMFSDEHSLL